LVAFAVFLLTQTGCAVAVLGAAAGGAALGYSYLRGVLSRDYPALLGDTIRTTKLAMSELGFPIVKEKTDTGTAYIQSKTADNDTITIYFDVVPSAVPTDGAMTRVTIRVGFAGDDVVSARILDQISKHIPSINTNPGPSLSSAVPPVPPSATPTSGIPAPPPVPATAPPPLAPTGSMSLSPRR
jgi:hypothetical protein